MGDAPPEPLLEAEDAGPSASLQFGESSTQEHGSAERAGSLFPTHDT